MRILSTKKLQPNQKQFLLNADFSVIDADFITIENKKITLEGINDNLIFTSANAVKAIAEISEVQDIRRNPCFCVGEKTAGLLDEVGFTVVEIADNASQLAEIIKNGYKNESFTFFCGNLRMETLPLSLKISGISFNEIEVYDTALNPQEIKADIDGILFFSPSGVESYLVKNTINDEVCFCVGETTAKALQQTTKNIIIANKPSVENVIIQCINYYKQ
jgi:uroporphyrinogen-III synthase